MIKNVRVKKLLTNTVFKLLSCLNYVIPKDDNLVLFYSNMGFRDNIEYLYDFTIKSGYNKKYRIIRSQNEAPPDVIPYNVRIERNARSVLSFLRAGHVFYCFGKLPIYPSKKQIVIQMWHGSPFKGMDKGVEITRTKKPYYTYYLAASDFFRPAIHKAYSCDDSHIAICGNPRNDVMYESFPLYNLAVQGKKKIIWMPTFRKSTKLGYADTRQKSIIPFYKNEELIELNEILGKLKVGLIVKIHPSQDLDLFENIQLSNINILSHQMFSENGYDLYRLLAQTDALITDYSSVFYDYMLLDRPIAFTMEDFEEYSMKRGFIIDNPEKVMAGHKIHNKEDLLSFLKDVSDGNDPWKEERNEINCIVNTYRDGQNRKRVLDISNITLS